MKASPGSAAADAADAKPTNRPALDPASVQYLLAEFGYFESRRAAIVGDASARAALFMNSVAAGTVALALVAQLSGLGPQFLVFSLVVLPTLLFLGLGTFRRLNDLNIEDTLYLVGLTRIRVYFQAAEPGLKPYDVFIGNDDLGSLAINSGQLEVQPRPSLWRVLVTTPGTVATVCGVIAGAIAAVLLTLAAVDPFLIGALAVAAGVATVVALFVGQLRAVRRIFGAYRPRFPGPPREIHPAFEDDNARPA